ncbi:MAG: hypothetical protein ACP5JU_02305, partial [Minisyncoccia bacterium]
MNRYLKISLFLGIILLLILCFSNTFGAGGGAGNLNLRLYVYNRGFYSNEQIEVESANWENLPFEP